MKKTVAKTLTTALLGASCLLYAGGALAQAASAPPPPNYPDSVKAYVAAAKKEIKVIKMAEFRKLVDENKAGLIVDVREADEVADGHVPGAVHVPRGLLEFQIWEYVGFPKAVDMNKQMTIYCKSGGRAALAAKTLKDLGFTNVASVEMPFGEWVKGGNPLVKPK